MAIEDPMSKGAAELSMLRPAKLDFVDLPPRQREVRRRASGGAVLWSAVLLGAVVLGGCRTTPASGESMTTRAIVASYLDALKSGGDWEPLFSESMTFTSFSSPVKQV